MCCGSGKLLYLCGEKVVPLSCHRIYLNKRWCGFLFFIASILLLNMGTPYDFCPFLLSRIWVVASSLRSDRSLVPDVWWCTSNIRLRACSPSLVLCVRVSYPRVAHLVMSAGYCRCREQRGVCWCPRRVGWDSCGQSCRSTFRLWRNWYCVFWWVADAALSFLWRRGSLFG